MSESSKFDAADHLDTPEMIAACLTEAFKTNDTAFVSLAIGTAARAKGITQVAGEAGVSRESLYKSLNGQPKPEFDAVRRVLATLSVKLVAEPIDGPEAA